MTAPLLRGLGFILGGLAMLGIAALSEAPYRSGEGELGMIRLTWRARPEQVETCRIPSPEELAELPAHMRQQVICSGFSARYRLKLTLGETTLLDEVVRGSGLRHDRPMYVLRDLPATPGLHRLEVSFNRVDSVVSSPGEEPDSSDESGAIGATSGRSQRETQERRRGRLEAVPPSLVLRQDVTIAPGQVVVVSYDAERRKLVLLAEATPR